eukprot:gene11768-biopygen15441
MPWARPQPRSSPSGPSEGETAADASRTIEKELDAPRTRAGRARSRSSHQAAHPVRRPGAHHAVPGALQPRARLVELQAVARREPKREKRQRADRTRARTIECKETDADRTRAAPFSPQGDGVHARATGKLHGQHGSCTGSFHGHKHGMHGQCL